MDEKPIIISGGSWLDWCVIRFQGGTIMAGMKMAKSSTDEMGKMLEFFNGLEAIFEGEFDVPAFDDYEAAQKDAIGEYVFEWREFLSASWSRFYWGFDTLLRSVCDPGLDYLDFKPEIKEMMAFWPWELTRHKKSKHDQLRQLAIAGALIAAEIDRLQRETAVPEDTQP